MDDNAFLQPKTLATQDNNDTRVLIPTPAHTNRSNIATNTTSQPTLVHLNPRSNSFNSSSCTSNDLANQLNLFQRTVQEFKSLTLCNKLVFLTNIVSSLMPLIASPTMLALTDFIDPCNKRLVYFVILHMLCWTINIPTTIHHYLIRGNIKWMQRVKSINDVMLMLIFVVGTYFLFSPSGCDYKSNMYYYCLFLVIYSCMLIVVPVVICGTIVVCLPCVIVGMRLFGNTSRKENKGATPFMIDKIPLYMFKTKAIKKEKTDKEGKDEKKHTFKKFCKKIKTIFNSKKSKNAKEKVFDIDADIESIEFDTIEEAKCTICLEEYTDKQLIRHMKCNHHYHQKCVDSWLRINKACPLCKRELSIINIDTNKDPATYHNNENNVQL